MTAAAAASQFCAAQDMPPATLYVVATPIGNLADITLRALHALQVVDVLACEDTRHTAALLKGYGIHTKSLLAVHEHNEREAAQTVIARLQAGARVAYVSDAGTPAISDPGARLVAAVRTAGHRVLPLPGVSSATAAISAAGVVSQASGFDFLGFLEKPKPWAAQRAQEPQRRPTVLFEAPHRIEATAQALAALGQEPITICRELTKRFEHIHTLPAEQLAPWLAQDPNHTRGEFALVLHGLHTPADANTPDPTTDRLLQALLPHLKVKTAVAIALQTLGGQKNALYARALQLSAASEREMGNGEIGESETGERT